LNPGPISRQVDRLIQWIHGKKLAGAQTPGKKQPNLFGATPRPPSDCKPWDSYPARRPAISVKKKFTFFYVALRKTSMTYPEHRPARSMKKKLAFFMSFKKRQA
jgi:hypothetical protein